MNRYLIYIKREALGWPEVGMKYKTDRVWTITEIDGVFVKAVNENKSNTAWSYEDGWWDKYGDCVIHE